jgi:hypothetical protein
MEMNLYECRRRPGAAMKNFNDIYRISASFVIVLIGLLLLGCGKSAIKDKDSQADALIPKDFWGTWNRMDVHEIWKFRDSFVEITNLNEPDNPEVTFLTFRKYEAEEGVYQLSRGERELVFLYSDNYIQYDVREIGPDPGQEFIDPYYLCRDGGVESSFTGTVLQHQEPRGLSLGSLGSVKFLVENLENASDIQTVTTGENGEFVTDEYIVGDSYEISIVGEDTAIEVSPEYADEDIGSVILTELPYNFKARFETGKQPVDVGSLGSSYAESSETILYNEVYSGSIVVKNIGSETAVNITCTFIPAEGLDMFYNLTNVIPSVPGDDEFVIPVSFQCADFGSGDFIDHQITVRLEDEQENQWEDSVSIRFYKESFDFSMITWADRMVNGVLLSPDNRALWFTSFNGILTMQVPYRSDGYLLSIGSSHFAASYSISFDKSPPPVTSVPWDEVYDSYEPNDTELDAPVIYIGDSFVSYTGERDSTDYEDFDLDFYRILPPAGTLP